MLFCLGEPKYYLIFALLIVRSVLLLAFSLYPIIFLCAAILCKSHSCRSSRLIRSMADQFYYIGYFSGFRGCISWFIPQLWTWWIFFLIARTYTRRYNWVNLSSRLKVCIWLILGPFLHLLFWNLIFTVTDFDDSRNRRIDSQMCCLDPP